MCNTENENVSTIIYNGEQYKRASKQSDFKVGDEVYISIHTGTPEHYHNRNSRSYNNTISIVKVLTSTGDIYLDNDYYYKPKDLMILDKDYVPKPRHIHADLMIQYANDPSLEIEFCSSGYGWIVTQDPGWLPNFKYRIKPKTKTVVKYKYYIHDPFSKEDKISGCYYIDDVEFKKYNPSCDIIQRLDKTAKEFTVRYE